ncbi:MAG: hypothetical protein KatS3mg052_1524 [Candidatus Roseilinea sp.]|nr:MAG: hypothetical protein KatS3mg052_1524 [Candidatus Roseilinea sp.]
MKQSVSPLAMSRGAMVILVFSSVRRGMRITGRRRAFRRFRFGFVPRSRYNWQHE